MTDLSGGRRFWLGGKVGWSWSDGTPWDYENWGPGQPSTDGGCLENSALLFGEDEEGTWNDRSCGLDDLGYVCKISNQGEQAIERSCRKGL